MLGGPGSGKGTQCDKIVKKYGFTHLSTGDLLREEVASGSDRGKRLKVTMELGELVSNETVLKLLKAAMDKEAATTNGYLIDGYPREKEQGALFEQMIGPVDVVLFFDVAEQTLVKRLLHRAKTSGRADDNEETIKLRLKTFNENNDKVVAQYPDRLKRVSCFWWCAACGGTWICFCCYRSRPRGALMRSLRRSKRCWMHW